MSSGFLKFFKYFLLFRIPTQYLYIYHFSTTICWLVRQNGERGIWTLAPLLTTYSLSRGAPSASWVLLQMQNKNHQISSMVSDAEGGIRTHAPSRTNGFQDRLVMTTSIPLRIFWAYSNIISAFFVLVNTFFNFF